MENEEKLITDEQWKFYEENGYLHLGKLLSTEELKRMQVCTFKPEPP
jgi:hypothetical protein